MRLPDADRRETRRLKGERQRIHVRACNGKHVGETTPMSSISPGPSLLEPELEVDPLALVGEWSSML